MSDAVRSRRIGWLAGLGTMLINILGRTWRVRVANGEVLRVAHAAGKPVILVLWHGQLLPLLWAHRNRQITIMISEHGDGEILARVSRSLGCRAVRGSTTRAGARALLGAAREVEAGFDLAITPDGPRGPARSVAPGALVIAQRTGAPLLPVAAWASRAWRLRSWDGLVIPKPFARIVVAYSPLMHIASDSASQAIESSDAVRASIDAASDLAASEAAQ